MKKQLILLSAMLILATSIIGGITGVSNVKAVEVQEVYEMTVSNENIIPHADVIVRKYRVINGVTQYRRWNETKGYWVDSEWLPLD